MKGSIISLLNNFKPHAIAGIDPFNTGVGDAIEKIKYLKSLASPLVILSGTDYHSFEQFIPNYINEIKSQVDIKILTHFPQKKGFGFPLAYNADAIILPCLLTSKDEYYYKTSFIEFEEKIRTGELKKEALPEIIYGAGLTFFDDPKSEKHFASAPADASEQGILQYCETIKNSRIEIVYLFSRHGRVSATISQLFRKNIRRDQLLFVSGGIKTKEDINICTQNGADFVVFVGALEKPDWKETLNKLINP
jgi:heptaprenylglyceryl phosphate synthase